MAIDINTAVENAAKKISANPPTVEVAPQVESTAETPAEETQAANPEGTPEVAEPRSTQLAALARKERELRERDEALKQREAALAQAKPEPAPDKPQSPLDALGLSREDIIALAMVEQLGEDAPPDVALRAERAKQEIRLKELEQKLQKPVEDPKTDTQDPAFAAVVAVKESEVHSFVDTGVPSDYAMVSALAKEEPMDAKKGIAEIIGLRYQKDGVWISASAAAQILEDAFQDEYEKLQRWNGHTKAASKTTTPAGDDRQSETLSDADVATTPDRGKPTYADFMDRLDETAKRFAKS